MKKPLYLISCIPDSPQFLWETANNLFNQRKYGLSNKARVLIFLTYSNLGRGFDSRWKFLENKFPEVQFFYYKDFENIERIIRVFNYIPLLRPWMLHKHWQEFPELEDSAIYYHDSDTVFTTHPHFLYQLKDNDINYLSDTKSYLNSDYFESKEKDIIPEKKELYNKIDVLEKLSSFMNLSKEDFIKNKNNTGGAQYLLKNITKQFWTDVFNNSIDIRTYLVDINKRFFESEEKGFQSWCADMWAVLGNLWKRKMNVVTPKEMDFCFSTDWIEEWDKKLIYHDANGSEKPVLKNEQYFRVFWKKGPNNSYVKDWESQELKSPFDDNLSYVSNRLCSYNYVKNLLETKKFLL